MLSAVQFAAQRARQKLMHAAQLGGVLRREQPDVPQRLGHERPAGPNNNLRGRAAHRRLSGAAFRRLLLADQRYPKTMFVAIRRLP